MRISESLTGRVERIPLWTLSRGEIGGDRETFLSELLQGRPPRIERQPIGRRPIAEAVVRGGYPEMVAQPSGRRRVRWLQSYQEMILARDVRDLTERARQLDYRPKLLRIAGSRVGGLVDLTSIGREIEMKRDSARRGIVLNTGAETLPFGKRLWAAPVGGLWA